MRVCMITGGAGSGIGAGVSAAAAAAGYHAVITDRDEAGARARAAVLADAGNSASAVVLDVSHPQSVHEAFAKVVVDHGRVDALINSAGIGLVKPAAEVTLEEYEQLMATNLRGAWLCTREVLPSMVASGSGSIVNVGSVQALGPDSGYAIYAAAKAGLVGLSRGIAVDYGAWGVRCNVIHPGLVDSPQTREIIAAWGEEPDAWMARFLQTRQLIPRSITSDHIGAVAAFLISDEAAAITGQEIVVDAGSTVMAFDRE